MSFGSREQIKDMRMGIQRWKVEVLSVLDLWWGSEIDASFYQGKHAGAGLGRYQKSLRY